MRYWDIVSNAVWRFSRGVFKLWIEEYTIGWCFLLAIFSGVTIQWCQPLENTIKVYYEENLSFNRSSQAESKFDRVWWKQSMSLRFRQRDEQCPNTTLADSYSMSWVNRERAFPFTLDPPMDHSSRWTIFVVFPRFPRTSFWQYQLFHTLSTYPRPERYAASTDHISRHILCAS